MTEPSRQPAGGDKQRMILEIPWAICGPASGLVLVKAGLSSRLSPAHVQPSPTDTAANCGSLLASNRLPRARHRLHLTSACSTVPAKRPRTNTSRGQLQTTSEQDLTHFPQSVSKGRSQQALPSAEAHSAFLFFPFLSSFLFIPHSHFLSYFPFFSLFPFLFYFFMKFFLLLILFA